MGFIKGAFKVVGTATLAVTGSVSAILKGVADTVGFELGSELLEAAKDASFNGIRSVWDGGGEAMDMLENASYKMEGAADSIKRSSARSMADTARKAALIAKQKGDEDKYEELMEKYQQYKDMSQ